MEDGKRRISLKKVFILIVIFLFYLFACAIYNAISPILPVVSAISSIKSVFENMKIMSAGEIADYLRDDPEVLLRNEVNNFDAEGILQILDAVEKYNQAAKREVTVSYEYTHYKGKVESWNPETGDVSITGWEETYKEKDVVGTHVEVVGQKKVDNTKEVEKEKKMSHGPNYVPPPAFYYVPIYETVEDIDWVDKTKKCDPVIETKSDQIILSRPETELEGDVMGENIFELDWRPILALCIMMTQAVDEKWNRDTKDRDFLSEEEVDAAINVFGYQYSYIDDPTVEESLDGSASQHNAYRLIVEGDPVEGEVCEFTVRKVPQIAPKLVANSYLSYEYEYTDQENGTKVLSARTMQLDGDAFIMKCAELVPDFDVEIFAEYLDAFDNCTELKRHYAQISSGIFYEDRTEDPEKCPCIGTIVSSSSGWVVHSAAQFYAGIVGLSYDGAPRPSGATVVSSVDWRPSQVALQDEQFRKIWKVASSCIGTKYVYGGNGGPGKDFDCSAFVTYVYRNSGFSNIYRMSTIGLIGGYTDITTNGYVTKIDYPEPGDLIFFKGTNPERPANYVSHVAIYLGEGMMIHASSSAKGVVVAPYEDSYLKTNHFLCYGRVRSDR